MACDLLVHTSLPGLSPGVRSKFGRRSCDLRQNRGGHRDGQRYPRTKENPDFSDISRFFACGRAGVSIDHVHFTELIYLRVDDTLVSCRNGDVSDGILRRSGCGVSVENTLKTRIIRLKRSHLGAVDKKGQPASARMKSLRGRHETTSEISSLPLGSHLGGALSVLTLLQSFRSMGGSSVPA